MGKSYKRNSSHKPRSHGRTFEKKKKGEWKKQQKWNPEPVSDQVDGMDEN